MIPKIIFQTYKTQEIPAHWKSSPVSIKKYMPDWQYVFMTDIDNLEFVKTHFPSFLNWFANLKYPIQRADVIRYMFLYVNGGLYLDMDIELNTSMEPLLQSGSDTFLVKAPRNWWGHYTNFLMASTPKNKFFLAVLDECLKPISNWLLPHHIISSQTGIGALNRAVKRFSITSLPFHSLVPCDYCFETSCDKPFYYTKFLKGQSWNNLDTYALNFLSCHYDVLALIIVSIVIIWILKKR